MFLAAGSAKTLFMKVNAMDIWIITDSDRLVKVVHDSLQDLGLECPASHTTRIESLDPQLKSLTAFDGILLFAVDQLETEYLELLKRLRTTTHDDATIVVVSKIDNHGTVLNAIRSGASDFIAANDNVNEELANSITRLKLQRKHREIRGRVISILPCYSARDASLLSVNLAAIVAKQSRSCALLDLQMRDGDLTMLLQLSPRHTIIDLLKQQGTIDQALFEQALTTHDSGIRLLAGPNTFIDMRSVRPQVCHQIIGLAQRLHDFVIVNSEDLQHAEQLRAFADSDDIVMTMRPDVVSLRRAKQHMDLMTQNRLPRENIHVVVLGSGHSTELATSSITKVLQVTDIHRIPDDPVSTLRAVNVGNPLVCECPNTKISQAIAGFAETLIRRHEAPVPQKPPKRPSSVKAALSVAMNSLSFAK
ncbi:hypothetical protein Mal52_47330 [Symmachiella dynata]|uniref:Response regulatory domain-containing protein n=1 Tax=Symmachiella dynata TaxID=2527995 RepID=A0A517ZUU4_9PLAN|nr:hypothetical protein [Symmachiella dynata]QDU46215.1 hypothetical protein Mal52_47330 [Symmachiella dynata]